VIAQLRDLACPVVLGNADAFLLANPQPSSDAGASEMSAVRAWTMAQLNADDLAFMRAFRPNFELPLENGRRLCCYHGTPEDYDQQILPDTQTTEARALLRLEPGVVGTGGHTHVQFMLHLDRTFHFNPGSVGFAYRHHQPHDSFRADPWAEYALLSDRAGRISLDFRRVPFDSDRLIEVYGSSGRPHADSSIRRYRA
jgi:predicted phosphodiesterase